MKSLYRASAVLAGILTTFSVVSAACPEDCPPTAVNCICVSGNLPGTQISPLQLLGQIAVFAVVSAAIICTCIFIIGAFFLVASHGKDDLVQKGKDFMTGALIGLVVVLGSYGLLRTMLYAIYYL